MRKIPFSADLRTVGKRGNATAGRAQRNLLDILLQSFFLSLVKKKKGNVLVETIKKAQSCLLFPEQQRTRPLQSLALMVFYQCA